MGRPVLVRDLWLYYATTKGKVAALSLRNFTVSWRWGQDMKIAALATDSAGILVGSQDATGRSAVHLFRSADDG